MALTFYSSTLTVAQIQQLMDMHGFNRIALQHYTTNGTDFTLVAQAMSPAREKVGPPAIILTRAQGPTFSPTGDFIFGQYELTKVQIKKLSKDGTTDITFKPKSGSINPETTDYDANGEPLHPCPPNPPPNP